MHRHLLLGSAAAVALISGAAMLTTSPASAQINIEGLIRGAMSHGYYGGYSRHHRGKVHESSHERRSKNKEDADDEGPSKDKDDTASKGDVKPAANRGDSSPAPAANANPPRQPVADVPNLTPER